MVKHLHWTVLFFLLSTAGMAQVTLEPISRADSLLAVEPRPVVVVVTAPWCKWCEKLKQQTLKDERLSALDDRFYFFELNDESDQDVQFYGGHFRAQSGDHHELTLSLLGAGKISLPSIIVLNTRGEVVFEHRSFMNANALNAALTSMQ